MMWSLLGHRTQVLVFVGAGIILAWALDGLYAFIAGHKAGILHWISFVAFLVGAVLTFIAEQFWRPLWRRFPFLARMTFPDLNGKWTGHLISTWIDPTTGQPRPPISTTIIIRQTLFRTSVSLSTAESISHSTRSVLEPHYDVRHFKLWYSYNNDPHARHQHRSSPHEGVAFLEMDLDADPRRLTGRYYTARKTTGDIDIHRDH